MNFKINISQQLKFNFWYFSYKYPFFSKPIQLLGKIYTSNFLTKYKKKLQVYGINILPYDRYKRDKSTPKQFYVLKSNLVSDDELLIIGTLLNHIRVPFSVIKVSEISSNFFSNLDVNPVLIGSKLSEDEINKVKKSLNKMTYKIIIFSKDNEIKKESSYLSYLNYDPIELLSFNLGFRSEIVEKFINILMDSKFLIITGFLPPQVALRIDDVEGKNIQKYIPIINKNGWTPNLGVFLDSFNDNLVSKSYISLLNKENKVELSPHAYNVKKFIFYDVQNAKPISKNEFEKKWMLIETNFSDWGWVISPVVNAHFHAYSEENFEIFKKKNIKYIFSDFSPGKLDPIPNKMYLPLGDPTCTTGQLNKYNISQIYSGDASECSNQSYSFYDFLMHNKDSDKVNNAFIKIKKRLNESLFTGFAAFITTHEYLINKLSNHDLITLFNKVDNYINENKFKPKKVTLSEIGRACENHTNIIIQSIEKKGNNYKIKLLGNSNEDSSLVAFFHGKMKQYNFSQLSGEKILNIKFDKEIHEL